MENKMETVTTGKKVLSNFREKCVGSFYQEPAWKIRMNELTSQNSNFPDYPQTSQNS